MPPPRRRITTPWYVWTRSRFPSTTRTFTLTVSPGPNDGTSRANGRSTTSCRSILAMVVVMRSGLAAVAMIPHRGPLLALFDGNADEGAPLRPGTVIVPDVRDAQELGEHEPCVGRTLADPAVGDSLLVQIDALVLI